MRRDDVPPCPLIARKAAHGLTRQHRRGARYRLTDASLCPSRAFIAGDPADGDTLARALTDR
jgi:hypothetical protein